MTYNEFINKQASVKKVLFQIGRLTNVDDAVWITQEYGIWEMTYSWDDQTPIDFSYGFGSFGLMSYGFGGTSELPPAPPNESVFTISSVVGDGNQLLEVFTIEELRTNSGSFLWDFATQTISINSVGNRSPKYEYATISVGVTKGYSNYGGYYGSGLYYDSRILSVPNISTRRDNAYFGKVSFEGGSISLDNTDGFFDSFGSENYYGSEVTLLFGGDDLNVEEYKNIYSGFVEDFSFSDNKIEINFKDNRKLLTNSIPDNTFNTIDYPSIDEDFTGSSIPLGYGVIRKAKATFIGSNTFKFVDTSIRNIQSIGQVYVNNIAVAHTSPSLTQGTFQTTAFVEGDDVSVDFNGYVKDDLVTLMENPVDIMQDILTNYTTVKYSSSFFNIINWEQARADSDKLIGILIEERTEIIDVIELISSSVFGSLVIDAMDKINFNYRDTAKASISDIDVDEFINKMSIESGSQEYLNTARVRYGKSWIYNRYKKYINTVDKEVLFREFRKNIEQEYDTVLSLEADAIALSNDIMTSFGGIFPSYHIETKTQNIDLEVGDNININAKLRLSSVDNWVKCEVIEKDIDLNDFSVSLKLRYIEDVI